MSHAEIIAKLEEIEKEDLSPADFAKKSAQAFNTWAEENPAELERLAVDRYLWCRAYTARVHERMKDTDWDSVFGRTTQEENKP